MVGPELESPAAGLGRCSIDVKEDIISAKVFVGNLSYETSQTDLETLFSEVGPVVEVFLPTDRMTERPRGFAFVEFSDAEAVSTAIEKLDGAELHGRNLRVSEARDRPARPPGGFERAPWAPPRGARAKPKGSRRGIRGRKRGF